MKPSLFRALALFAISLLASPVNAETTELSIAFSSRFKAAYERVAVEIEKQIPGVRIQLRVGSVDDDELVQQSLREALMNDRPDMMFMSNNRVRLLAERGLAQPIDAFIAGDADWKQNFEGPIDATGKIAGRTYALPLGFSAPVVMYNLDLVRKAGGDPAALPKSWDDIIALGKRISAAEPGTIGAYFEHDNSGNWTFMTLIDSLGGRMMNDDETAVAFGGPEGLRALEILRAFGEAGQAKVDMTSAQAKQAFSAGQIGILITTSSVLANFEKAAAGRFEPRLEYFPISVEGGGVAASGPTVMMFTEDPAKQALAWRVMKAAVSPEVQTVLATVTSYLPVNAQVLTDHRYLGERFSTNENAKRAAGLLRIMKPWYTFPEPNAVRITELIRDRLQAVATLKQTPEAALAEMVQTTTSLLPQR